MYGIEWLLGVGGGGLVLGLIVGYALKQFAFGGSKKEADLQASLAQAQEELADYQAGSTRPVQPDSGSL